MTAHIQNCFKTFYLTANVQIYFRQIIGMIGFSLLSFGAGIAVGVISYEAIDWDSDDFGDGDGKV